MSYSGEIEWMRQQEQTARFAAEDTARAALPCPECGCPDGLDGWSRECVLAAVLEDRYSLPTTFYRADGYDPEHIYTLCQTCQAATTEVLSRCELLSASDIAAWVLEDECGCILDQTCSVCSLAAQIERKWSDDAPLPF